MTDHIPIFCATDENYAPFASIMMKSLLLHTKSFIDFYVMDGGIQNKTKKLIERDLKEFPNKCIRWVDMSPYNLKKLPSSGRFARFTENAFARYFVPEIAPHLKKAIYMDVDIIVKSDILELYNQELQGYPVGATPCDFSGNIMIGQIRRICPDVKPETIALNSGLFLMDIPKLIDMNFTQNAVELTDILRDKVIFPDQDILNIIFANNYFPLDYRFDFINTTVAALEKDKHIKVIDPVMVHYTLKPWKQNYQCQQDFEEILQQSLFYKTIFKKYRSRKVKYLLLGRIPIFTKYVPKDEFLNQSFIENNMFKRGEGCQMA